MHLSKDSARHEPRPWGALTVESASVAVTTFLLLVVFQSCLDNVFVVTTNGLWKSVTVRLWAERPEVGLLDLANVLYFPVYGQLTRILDWMGVFPGLAWKQMAVLNAVFSAVALGCIYAWIAAAFRSRLAAVLTCLFYLGSGHFLALSAISEDILPGFFFTLAGMILGAVWFGRPTPARILIVALVITIGWLFEWRLLFPVVPPLLLALGWSADGWRQRAAWTGLFLLGLGILPAMVTVIVWQFQPMSALEALRFLGRLFWVGKGVGTGWAGFSVTKFHLAWTGMTQSVFGGRQLASLDWVNHPANIREVVFGSLVIILLATLALRWIWPRRQKPAVAAGTLIFGGTFAAGEFFNLYSQPQDPQMQINAMPWMIPAWTLFLMTLVLRPRSGNEPSRNAQTRLFAACLISALPLIYNTHVLAGYRGGNTLYTGLLERLEHRFPSSTTVYLYQGFDYVIPWQFATWSATWPQVERLPPAPADDPKFKWISITDGMIWHKDWTAQQHAEHVRGQIDRALSLGYRVVTNDLWEWPERKWVEWASTVAAPEVPIAIRTLLRERYTPVETYRDPTGETYFALERMTPGSNQAP